MDRSNTQQTAHADHFAMLPKIQKEIAFLKMRIDTIKKHHTPNHSMLKNFENMLHSRENILFEMHNKNTLSRISSHVRGVDD